MHSYKTFRFVLVAAILSLSSNAATIFNFDQDNLGTVTGFTDTVGGISATFSSSADPGGFVIYPSIFETLTGNVLGDPGPFGANNLNLNIGFNQNLAAITFNFATDEFTTTSPLTLTAYENAALVGTASSTPAFLAGFTFPEGEIAFAGLFNRLVLSTSAPNFAVDNIAVVPAPEPAGPALSLAGLFIIGAGFLLRRFTVRQQRS